MTSALHFHSLKSFTFCVTLLLSIHCIGQGLPKEFYFSADGRTLHVGGKPSTGLYNEDAVQDIRLSFPQTNYLTLLASNYAAKTNIPATMWHNGKSYDSVGVRFKGNTSYRMLGTSLKKSFNISADFVKSSQDVRGYKTLNLNNSYQDASMAREIFYYHQIRRHSAAPKANFVRLYVNDTDYGLYQNVQQINKDMMSEWFLSNDGTNWRADVPTGTTGGGGGGWGDGTAALNYLGDDTTAYKKYYTLKSSDQAQPWVDLPKVCKILNQAPLSNLEDSLQNYLDIDRTLWHLASEILFCDDDSYVYKGKMDYYLYQDAETKRFVTIDYDANSTMGANLATQWSPFYNETKANYPLLNRLLAVPNIRQRYLAHVRTLITEAFNVDSTTAVLNRYTALLDTTVQKDPIKLTTYAQWQTGIAALKTFITTRKNFLLNNAEVAQVAPSITQTAYYTNGSVWQVPTATQDVTIRTKITHINGLSQVLLYFGTGIYGKFQKTQMYDDGAHDDGAANDGVFGAKISKQNAATWVRYYIEAAANNTSKSIAFAPVGADHDVYVYQVQTNGSAVGDIVINEFMASNVSTVKDEFNQFDDWVELYNKGTQAVNIGGYNITDNPTNLTKWTFPANTTIPAGGYLIVWADEDSSQNTVGKYHANFKLSKSGEFLALLNASGQMLDSLTFGSQVDDRSLSRMPNGTGSFVIKASTFGKNNESATATNELENIGKITLAPNPTTGELNIATDGDPLSNLSVLNSIGQVMLSVKGIDNQQYTLDLSNYPNGFYFVKIGKSTVKKVILQR
jgi:CotH kinase protein/Lamin Tail Domain/Secretion system C-terminal sorting domain